MGLDDNDEILFVGNDINDLDCLAAAGCGTSDPCTAPLKDACPECRNGAMPWFSYLCSVREDTVLSTNDCGVPPTPTQIGSGFWAGRG